MPSTELRTHVELETDLRELAQDIVRRAMKGRSPDPKAVARELLKHGWLTDDDLLRRLAQAWTAKWDGQWEFQVYDGSFHHHDGEASHVFSVKPVKVLAFGKGNFSHTSHRF